MQNKCIAQKRSFKNVIREFVPVNIRLRITTPPRSAMALLTKWPVFLQKEWWQPYGGVLGSLP